jgi:14-3-3 protein epsilon
MWRFDFDLIRVEDYQLSMSRLSISLILAWNFVVYADLQEWSVYSLHLYIELRSVPLDTTNQFMLSIKNTSAFSILFFLFIFTMENLNINDNNGRNYVDPSDLSSDELLELCLVGTLLSNKFNRFHVMKEHLANLWKPGQGVSISAIEENKFLFQFFHLWDMERVFQGGPWLFDNHMLVLKKLKVGDDPLTTELDAAEMWVQIFNLPFGYMSPSIGELIGSHLGRFVKYDDYNSYGAWRLYMRIRVAVNVKEALKKSFTFEKEDGGIVHLHFKYEKLGVFCFECGLIGHSESFCPKKFDPNYVEGEKGWGNFIRAGNSAIGGGATINKWLRGGRSQNHGGRGGGRSNNGGAEDTTAATENLGVNVGQPIQHAIFGRVKVIRGGQGRGFTFHTAVTNSANPLSAYDEGVQWVPFVISTETLARPLINSAMGQRIVAERSTNMLQTITRTSVPMLAAAAAVSYANSALVVSSNSAAADRVRLTTAGGTNAAPLPIATMTNVMGQSSASMTDKLVTIPKKRLRIDQTVQTENSEVEQGIGLESENMQVDKHDEGLCAAGVSVKMQSNPLFVENIVKAGSGNQTRQYK